MKQKYRNKRYLKQKYLKKCSCILGCMLALLLGGCAFLDEQSEPEVQGSSALVGVDALREDLNENSDAQNAAGNSGQSGVGEGAASGDATKESAVQDIFSQENAAQEMSIDYNIQAILSDLEEQEAALVEKLQTSSLSQGEMNVISKEIYEIWDRGLNDIWGKLKAVLSEAEMSALTQEEREWIAYKEARAKEAGAEFEGGSMQPLIINDKMADLTRDRVYELAVHLGEKVGQSVTMPTVDLAGLYVDTQGTESVYSELELVEVEDRVYEVTIGLYRLTTLEGTAKVEGEVLYFEDENMQVKGEIFLMDEGAVFRATASEFEYISVGDVFTFPEKR